MPSLPVILAAVVGVTTPVLGQTINVRTLTLRAEDMPETFVKGAGGFVPLQFSSVQPTETVRALATSPLVLYRSETDAEGKQAFVVSRKVNLPDGARGILLLGWTSGGETRCVAIKDDFEAAAYNDWLLINASTRPVAFKVGTKNKPLLLKPGVSETHRISEEKGVGTAVLAQAPFDGKPKIFFSTYWPVYPDKRSLVLFVDDGNKILVKRISDKLGAPSKDS